MNQDDLLAVRPVVKVNAKRAIAGCAQLTSQPLASTPDVTRNTRTRMIEVQDADNITLKLKFRQHCSIIAGCYVKRAMWRMPAAVVFDSLTPQWPLWCATPTPAMLLTLPNLKDSLTETSGQTNHRLIEVLKLKEDSGKTT
eukprot:3577263-Amphidinium_carterae.1